MTETRAPALKAVVGPAVTPPDVGKYVLVGLDHRAAPIQIRERFHRSGELGEMLVGLRRCGLGEAVVLFTCNRFEVYGVAEDALATTRVVDHLAARCGLAAALLHDRVISVTGEDVVRHLARVAAGLESMVLGEPEILGQVAAALALARSRHAVGPMLTRLFTDAVRAGKRVRTETGIGRLTLSMTHAAVRHVASTRTLVDANALVVGAGAMAAQAVDALRAHCVRRVGIANRTEERAAKLAASCDGVPIAWADLAAAVRNADVVIAATGAATILIAPAHVTGRSAVRPLDLIDLAVPRNVDRRCGDVPGVRVYDVDDLAPIIAGHRAAREREVGPAEARVEEEVARHLAWVEGRRSATLIRELQSQSLDVVNAEVDRALRRLPELDFASRAVVRRMAERIVGRLLHAPVRSLKSRRDVADELAVLIRSWLER